MANYQFRPTGTRSSGASTVGDWSDANCYPASAILGITQADDDTFIFDENLVGAMQPHTATGQWILTKNIQVSTRFGEAGSGAVFEANSGTTSLAIRPLGANSVVGITDLNFTNNFTAGQMMSSQHFTNKIDITLTRVGFIGTGLNAAAVLGSENGNGSLTMIDCSVTGIVNGASIIRDSSRAAEDMDYEVTIDNLTIDIVTSPVAIMSAIKLTKSDTAFASTCTIKNSHMSCTSLSKHVQMVRLVGFNTTVVEDNVINVTSPSTSESVGINVLGNIGTGANRTNVGAITRRNTVNMNTTAGHAILIGEQGHTGLDIMQDSETYLNIATGNDGTSGAPHGITAAGLSSGKLWGNKINRFHQGLLYLYCDNDAVEGTGNFLWDIWDAALSYEGCSGGIMANNTVVTCPSSIVGKTTIARGIWARNYSGTANTGGKAYNNNIIVLGDTRDGMFIEVGTVALRVGDSFTYSNNNYYTDQVIPSNAWHYNNNTYQTLTLWNAGEGTDETDTLNFGGVIADMIAKYGRDVEDALVTIDNYGGGLEWFTGAGPQTLLEPLPNIDIDQGIQTANGPFHPSRL